MLPVVGWQVLFGAQLSPAGHEPQLRVPPQPSAMVPQPLPGQVFGVHVWVTQTLFVHVALVAQVPQASLPPQPSAMLPQFLPCAAQVVGVQVLPPWQVPFVHVSPTGQEHVIVPPQPSVSVPQAEPTPPEPQLVGTHVGWQVPLLDALHDSPAAQPQFSVPPQPSGRVPHESPCAPVGHALTVQPH
jgi:hypothetical protein